MRSDLYQDAKAKCSMEFVLLWRKLLEANPALASQKDFLKDIFEWAFFSGHQEAVAQYKTLMLNVESPEQV